MRAATRWCRPVWAGLVRSPGRAGKVVITVATVVEHVHQAHWVSDPSVSRLRVVHSALLVQGAPCGSAHVDVKCTACCR